MKLPVSGREVEFRVPDGHDDMAILEARGEAVERALAVVPRLARISEDRDGPPLVADPAAWAALTITDFEVVLLGLRRFLLGDVAACVFRCTSWQCGKRMETEFSITDFLGEIKPKIPRDVQGIDERRGWFKLTASGRDLFFRLPTVGDQIEVMGRPGAEKLLALRCIEGDGFRSTEMARVERAMDAMAPIVSRSLAGDCAECGQQVHMPLHVPMLVMNELSAAGAGIHEDVDCIAQTYHWDESSILTMPQGRRLAYAETIRRGYRATL
jgi:hypothetical protein